MRQLSGWNTSDGPHWLVEFKNLDEELSFLRVMVNKFRANPQIRDLAVTIIKDAGVPAKDKRGQALAIAGWVQQNIYYVHEMPERFQEPTETLRKKAGDCDDFTTLIASLNESIGIPTLFVVMQVNGAWAHIFPAARMPGGLLTLDATLSEPVDLKVNPVTKTVARGARVLLKIA